MPIDEEGSRLLFQVISDSYETRRITPEFLRTFGFRP